MDTGCTGSATTTTSHSHVLELEIGHQRVGAVHKMKSNELGRTERI